MSRINLPEKRKVGHLTLLRQGREISPREYNALAAGERLTMIREARGRQKYALMVEARDGDSLVPQVATQELYLMMRELGLEDMAEAVTLASPEQFTSLLDLDIWTGDDIDIKKATVWLQLILDGGEEAVCDILPAMESELVVLIFSRLVTVLQGPEVFEDEDVIDNANRLEGLYDLHYIDSENAKLVKSILDVLFQQQRAFFLWLMEAVRAETPSMLLEQAFQFHRGRMLDHGFSDPVDAQQVYSYADPHNGTAHYARKADIPSPEPMASAPSYVVRADHPQDLLGEILAAGIDDETAWEFSLLLNKVMMADAVDPGDRNALETVLGRVYRLLSLGLEHFAEGHADRARELFEELYLQDIFRAGYSLTLELQQWAGNMKNSPVFRWLDETYVHFLEGLLERRPRFYPGLGPDGNTQMQEFATRRQIRQATGWLEEIEAQEHLFNGGFPFSLEKVGDASLDGCVPEVAEDLTLSDIFLTALANKLLDGEFVPDPLPASRLVELHGLITTDGRVDAQLREGTVAWLEELQPDAGAFGHYCLDLWQQEFCPLAPEDVEPRYIGGLIIALGR